MDKLQKVQRLLEEIHNYNRAYSRGMLHPLNQSPHLISEQKSKEALAELKAFRENGDWQPIETAPKDGTEILIFNDCDYDTNYDVVVYDPRDFNGEEEPPWVESGGEYCHRYNATHWQPLTPPKKGE